MPLAIALTLLWTHGTAPRVTSKRVYFFGSGQVEGNAQESALLGGKGANLAEMTKLGLPVPPGFTIATSVCREFEAGGERLPDKLSHEIELYLSRLEKFLSLEFGSTERPLLLSVRSGPPISMPGVMDTILNIGLNDISVEGLAEQFGDRRFAYDTYLRLIAMYGESLIRGNNGGDSWSLFDDALAARKREVNVERDSDLNDEHLAELVQIYKEIIITETGRPFPQDPREQLLQAVSAVFRSWNSPRAVAYRRLNNITASVGTAAIVQVMVFGNLGDTSGTGVAFSRDPNTGESSFFGEYLINVQGQDVVSGIRTPMPINGPGEDTLKGRIPAVYAQLHTICQTLERHYQDMQDIEFTVQRGELFLLQTRTGKRTAEAAVCIAVDMVHEGLIDKRLAVVRVTPEHIDQLLYPMLDLQAHYSVLARGLPASPGVATGVIVLDPAEAESLGKQGNKVILVRSETSPEDVASMYVTEGVLTSRGGMTSHAALVARGIGRPCVVGCADMVVDRKADTVRIGDQILHLGDTITIDGSTGDIILGEVATVQAPVTRKLDELMQWADEYRRLRVRANAETPADATTALKFGAEGIGLCRTEHMFFGPERIALMRQMILADTDIGRRGALGLLAEMQREDFRELFASMAGLPVTIRLLDPPLKEFLPNSHEEVLQVAEALGQKLEIVQGKVDRLWEHHPMLGLSGCRLGVKYPEIYETQVQAIFEAAVIVKRSGLQVHPEIMVPLVMTTAELAWARAIIDRVATKVFQRSQVAVGYLVGAAIEVPRAALVADTLARHADFFSFGVHELTQLTLGISSDAAASFLPTYVEDGLLSREPFQMIDEAGVGRLIRLAIKHGRSGRLDIKLGMCGEHGGDPFSVAFSHRAGLDYVSCSPFRVPVARLAAAHAALQEQD
ncbi:MAG: pyruvate, phosphate dikinase [Myxococcales bacterium]|nr:pyruvate, phosphate dikinase [Myxococcales bacterium]